ncbi:MAG: UDP-glucose/GDP-mannose dehydrogenase family protein [Candidatus Sericytochromatia bacterium]|nr:UDP-glucose/GDP-mannose dehydrogenase family protein [Candidatus Sericytochromatia bacterium]
MDIAIIGSGYVGLVTGACFAHLGHRVVCVDNQVSKIEKLKAGQMPIYEPGLDVLVTTNVVEGRLRFSSDIAEATACSEAIFICVGTPPKPNGEADLSAFERVAHEMAPAMNGYKLIVEKSTVPVRTGEWLAELFRSHLPAGADFDIASNPEFLREGSAIKDFLESDRVVLGVNSDRAASLLIKLYTPLNAPILVTDLNSAELIKHASNAFLAMKISFINAVAQVCERTGADITKVAKGVGLDKRIGEQFLRAGVGYGGACFPKDVAAFISIAEKHGYDLELLRAVERINESQRQHVFDKIVRALDGQLLGARIGVLGLAFKPNTDDMRGAASVDIIRRLQAEGAEVWAYDPVAQGTAQEVLTNVKYAETPYGVAEGADCLVLLTEWNEFQSLNLPVVKSLMRRPIMVDGRNMFDPTKMSHLGFTYDSIGRPGGAPLATLAV